MAGLRDDCWILKSNAWSQKPEVKKQQKKQSDEGSTQLGGEQEKGEPTPLPRLQSVSQMSKSRATRRGASVAQSARATGPSEQSKAQKRLAAEAARAAAGWTALACWATATANCCSTAWSTAESKALSPLSSAGVNATPNGSWPHSP